MPIINNLLEEVWEVEHVEEEVGPGGTGDTTEEEASGELRPPFSGLQLVGLLLRPVSVSAGTVEGTASLKEATPYMMRQTLRMETQGGHGPGRSGP